MSLREIDYLCPNLPLFLIFFLKRGLGETMLAEASVLDAIAGKRVIGISSLAISVSSSGLMLLSEKIIFNKHWVHPVLYGPDLQFLPFSGHGHFGASAILSCHLVGKFVMKKALLDISWNVLGFECPKTQRLHGAKTFDFDAPCKLMEIESS